MMIFGLTLGELGICLVIAAVIMYLIPYLMLTFVFLIGLFITIIEDLVSRVARFINKGDK